MELKFCFATKFCSDKATLLDVCKHTVNWIDKNEKKKISSLIVLQLTSPLRKFYDINNCVKIFKKES